MLSRAERESLLGVAREAIRARLERRPPAPPPAAEGGLGLLAGAFVSLHRRADHSLRGCIGRITSSRPLLETVAEMAVAAATEDPRFPAVGDSEVEQLAIEISVLSPTRPLRPQEVQPGRHGLIARSGGRTGVLLPQVPVEQGWGRERFLDMTCRKAGLAEDAWRREGCEILGFEAEVFGEGETGRA